MRFPSRPFASRAVGAALSLPPLVYRRLPDPQRKLLTTALNRQQLATMYLASSVLVLLVCRLVDAQSPAPTAASPANIKIFPLSYDPHAAPRVCDLQASYEQEYAAVAQTASGHWYFRGVSDPSSFIYYDPDCDGQRSTGRWVLDEDAPSTTRAYDLDNDGDCHYSADLNSCANANDGAVDSDGDDCRYYDAFPSDCGMYDDDTFSASAMCCACGGGQEAFDAASVIPPLGEHTWEMYCSGDSWICTDSADGAVDSGGDGCEYYWGYPSECGEYDGPNPTPSPTVATPTNTVTVTGDCTDGYNDISYYPMGTTADGRPWYQGIGLATNDNVSDDRTRAVARALAGDRARARSVGRAQVARGRPT